MLKIPLYFTTKMVEGKQTNEERLEELIKIMQNYIDDFYCGHRCDYKNIKLIFKEAFKRSIEEHNNLNNGL